MAIEVASKSVEAGVARRLAAGEPKSSVRANLIASGCSELLADRYIGRATAKPITERQGRAVELAETSGRMFAHQQSAAVRSAWQGLVADALAFAARVGDVLNRKI